MEDLNRAIVDWINNDALEEMSIKVVKDNFQFYDPIQRKSFQTYLVDLGNIS